MSADCRTRCCGAPENSCMKSRSTPSGGHFSGRCLTYVEWQWNGKRNVTPFMTHPGTPGSRSRLGNGWRFSLSLLQSPPTKWNCDRPGVEPGCCKNTPKLCHCCKIFFTLNLSWAARFRQISALYYPIFDA